MQYRTTIEWQDPLKTANNIPKEQKHWCLLYSGLRMNFTGNKSILALDPKEIIQSNSFDQLSKKLSSDKQYFENAWFGYMGYELKHNIERFHHDKKSFIDAPSLTMINYNTLLIFDHEKQKIDIWSENNNYLSTIPKLKELSPYKHPEIDYVSSNMNKQEYLQNVKSILKHIKNGDLYQANLTRKFFGEFTSNANNYDIFVNLCKISPAPYSCYLKLGDIEVISSSPERFLYIDKQGNVETRPIKGTSKRFKSNKKDTISRNSLQNSIKDKSENLMIVDLSRNDLSRGCNPGSIKVSKLYQIDSYSTVHHMSSVISGKKKNEASSLELIKGCFPPGSMTGTPKIQAIKTCSELEKNERGIYSGCIGWLGGDGSADLSVVIRTIITKGTKFEFQVGGAIINDSNPIDEWNETKTKAAAICSSLGIKNIE